MKKKTLYVGHGEAGTVIVDKLSKKFEGLEKYMFKTINSSENDSNKAVNIAKDDRYVVPGVDGLAKKMEKVVDLMRKQGDEILENVFSEVIEGHVNRIVLVASLGGGTGCGMITQLARILKENINEDTRLRVILISPFNDEDIRAFKNSAIAIKAMEDLRIPVRIVSNGNFESREGRTLQEIHSAINNYVVETEFILNEANNHKTTGINTDEAEISTTLFAPGYQFVARVKLSTKDKEKNTREIIQKMKNSLDFGFDKESGYDYRLSILQASQEIESKINMKEIFDELGIAREGAFSTQLAATDEAYFTVIISGSSFPEELNSFYDKAIKHAELVEKSQSKKLDIDVSKLLSQPKKEDSNSSSVFDFLNKEEKKEETQKPNTKKWKISV